MKSQEQNSVNQPSASKARTQAEVRLKLNFTAATPILESGDLSPASLAYIGDAVYELYVRSYYLLPPRRISDYHRLVVAQVRAETQAAHLRSLESYLDESEREIVRRGRNAASGGRRGLSPAIYRQATSLETLLGYLYLKNPDRLNQLLELLELEPD